MKKLGSLLLASIISTLLVSAQDIDKSLVGTWQSASEAEFKMTFDYCGFAFFIKSKDTIGSLSSNQYLQFSTDTSTSPNKLFITFNDRSSNHSVTYHGIYKLDNDSSLYLNLINSKQALPTSLEEENLMILQTKDLVCQKYNERHTTYNFDKEIDFLTNEKCNKEKASKLDFDYYTIFIPDRFTISHSDNNGLKAIIKNETNIEYSIRLSIYPYGDYLFKRNRLVNYHHFESGLIKNRKSLYFTRNDLFENKIENSVYWRKEIKIYDEQNGQIYHLVYGTRNDKNTEPNWCFANIILRSLAIKSEQ